VTLVDFVNRILRSRASDDLGHELYSVERQLNVTGDGRSLLTRAPAADWILIDPALSVSMKVLRALEIPVVGDEDFSATDDEEKRRAAEVSSLGRWMGLVAWVIGADGGPQLWVEKDSFLPARLIVRADRGLREVNFERFRYFKDFPYPRTITAVRLGPEKSTEKSDKDNSDEYLRDELVDLVVNADMADLKKPLFGGFSDAGNAADVAVRDLIHGYYEFVR
jgi:hypothetical protein